MTIRRVLQPTEIYTENALIELMMTCTHAPTIGKVQSAAQTTYSKNQGFFYVFEENEKVIGLVGGSEIDGRRFVLKHLAVSKDHQKKGVATQLLDHLIESRTFEVLEVEADSITAEFFKKYGMTCKKSSDPVTDKIIYSCKWYRA